MKEIRKLTKAYIGVLNATQFHSYMVGSIFKMEKAPSRMASHGEKQIWTMFVNLQCIVNAILSSSVSSASNVLLWWVFFLI